MKERFERCVPAGIDCRTELKWIGYGLMASFIFSLGFLIKYMDNYTSLFHRLSPVERVLKNGVVMPDFTEILGSSLTGFLILAICMIAVATYHYGYHYQGSKSIYLMRRLPSRWELWRRCITLPILAAICFLLTAFILLFIYFGIYMAVTPKGCLTPNQWQKIWHLLIGVQL